MSLQKKVEFLQGDLFDGFLFHCPLRIITSIILMERKNPANYGKLGFAKLLIKMQMQFFPHK